jgi:hypothetical protein
MLSVRMLNYEDVEVLFPVQTFEVGCMRPAPQCSALYIR